MHHLVWMPVNYYVARSHILVYYMVSYVRKYTSTHRVIPFT